MVAIPKPVRLRDESRLGFARQRGCIIAKFHTCEGPVDAHHVVGKGQGRVGSKVSDRRTVGLCRAGHKLANRRDHFEELFPIVFEEEIARINREFDALPKVERASVEKSSKVEIKCACGKRHKKTRVEGAVHFYCTTTRENRRAS